MTGWEFFKIHHALELHFHTRKYDVFKYNGKIKVDPDNFGVRTDRTRFDYWAKYFSNKGQAGKFCIANNVYGSEDWIYKPYSEAEEAYTKWLKIKESLSNTLRTDLSKIIDIKRKHNISTSALFDKTPNGKYPPLLQIFNTGSCTVETMVIINKFVEPFIDKWNSICYIDPYVDDRMMLVKKYEPFVSIDEHKVISILEEKELYHV